MNRLTIAALAALVLTACGGRQTYPPSEKPDHSLPVTVGKNWQDWDVRRISGPDEFGVVCYERDGATGISCVQVMPPQPSRNP